MARSKPTHVTRGNVLDDLGFSPEQAAVLKFKADLYQAVLKHARKYSPKQLQVILGEPQPRVSELLNGKIANKSVGKLLSYAGRLGIETKAKFVHTRDARFRGGVRKGVEQADRGEFIDEEEMDARVKRMFRPGRRSAGRMPRRKT